MWACAICRFETELDDVVLTCGDGRCICLRCFERETGSARPMPKGLRQHLVAALIAAEPA